MLATKHSDQSFVNNQKAELSTSQRVDQNNVGNDAALNLRPLRQD